MSNEGMTPLDYIRKFGDKEMENFYLRLVREAQESNMTAIEYTHEKGYKEVEAFLQGVESGIKILESGDKEKASILISKSAYEYALETSNKDMIDLLKDGKTALDCIRQSGNREMLSYLRGMEVVVGRTEKTNDAEQGKTAYDYALETGNPEIIALMQNASRKR